MENCASDDHSMSVSVSASVLELNANHLDDGQQLSLLVPVLGLSQLSRPELGNMGNGISGSDSLPSTYH